MEGSMAINQTRMDLYQRWTWRRQLMDCSRIKILSPIKSQKPHDGMCVYYALAVTLEANLRVQIKEDVELSTAHLRDLNNKAKKKELAIGVRFTKAFRLLETIQYEAVLEEDDYTGTRQSGPQGYKIKSFSTYDLKKTGDTKDALYELRRGGPLLAVIRISDNYNDCLETGNIYRFDPKGAITVNTEVETHAVSVVSFALEGRIPCFECQDSKGEHGGRNGFLFVDITSVKELYSIRV